MFVKLLLYVVISVHIFTTFVGIYSLHWYVHLHYLLYVVWKIRVTVAAVTSGCRNRTLLSQIWSGKIDYGIWYDKIKSFDRWVVMSGEHNSTGFVQCRHSLCCSGLCWWGFEGLWRNKLLYCFAFVCRASILCLCEECCFLTAVYCNGIWWRVPFQGIIRGQIVIINFKYVIVCMERRIGYVYRSSVHSKFIYTETQVAFFFTACRIPCNSRLEYHRL
jgi:hypothetical protein